MADSFYIACLPAWRSA